MSMMVAYISGNASNSSHETPEDNNYSVEEEEEVEDNSDTATATTTAMATLFTATETATATAIITYDHMGTIRRKYFRLHATFMDSNLEAMTNFDR